MDANPDQPQDPTKDLIEKRLNLAELIIKYLAIFSTIIGGFFALFQYLETRVTESKHQSEAAKTAADLRRKEFQLDFFRKELELYAEASRTTGILAMAASPDDEASKRAIDRFYSLYWGDLSIVEDEAVEAAMVEFEVALRAWRNQGGKATADLRSRSIALAHRCRDSMMKRFDLDLAKLDPKPEHAVKDLPPPPKK